MEYLCPGAVCFVSPNVQEWDLMKQRAGHRWLHGVMESSSSEVAGAGECGNWLHKSISAQNIPPHSGLQTLQYRGQLKVTSPPPCTDPASTLQCRISAGV